MITASLSWRTEMSAAPQRGGGGKRSGGGQRGDAPSLPGPSVPSS